MLTHADTLEYVPQIHTHIHIYHTSRCIEVVHLAMAGTLSVITLWGDEKDSTLDQLHFCTFDLIIHIHRDEQQSPQKGATMKASTLLSDKGTMIRAWSQRWCHIFFLVWLDRGRKSSSRCLKSSLVWPVSCLSSGFFSWCQKFKNCI